MRISEIFYSIQGEGRLAGVPSVFVRLAGCNLRCRWCDTPYALQSSQGDSMTIPEIIEKVLSFNCRHIVVTGGEPMIAKGLCDLLEQLKSREKHITIETAGTKHQQIPCDLMSVSPKLSHSTPTEGPFAQYAESHEKTRLNIAALQNLMDSYDYQMKFVVNDKNDLAEIADLVNKLTGVETHRVMLMPEGRTKTELRRKNAEIAQLCLEQGFAFCSRLQIELWGNKKGT